MGTSSTQHYVEIDEEILGVEPGGLAGQGPDAVISYWVSHFFNHLELAGNPGEKLDVKIETVNGNVRLTGTASSASVHQSLRDLVPRIKEKVEGAKSIDVSGVRIVYPKT